MTGSCVERVETGIVNFTGSEIANTPTNLELGAKPKHESLKTFLPEASRKARIPFKISFFYLGVIYGELVC